MATGIPTGTYLDKNPPNYSVAGFIKSIKATVFYQNIDISGNRLTADRISYKFFPRIPIPRTWFF
ncbi:MAG: hypothetical protein CMF69_12350 [Magnetovibrio sp.]|nr:hypothetical protein [Magnetovibrio sp.]